MIKEAASLCLTSESVYKLRPQMYLGEPDGQGEGGGEQRQGLGAVTEGNLWSEPASQFYMN